MKGRNKSEVAGHKVVRGMVEDKAKIVKFLNYHARKFKWDQPYNWSRASKDLSSRTLQ